jgi:hypothetical protein
MFAYIVKGEKDPDLDRAHSVRGHARSDHRQEFVMNIDRAVFTLAGTMVLVSLALGWLVSPYWLLLTAFVGANMLQASFTGFCPAALIFSKLGLEPGPAFTCSPTSR